MSPSEDKLAELVPACSQIPVEDVVLERLERSCAWQARGQREN